MKKDLKYSFDCYFNNKIEFDKCLEIIKHNNLLPEKIVIGTHFPDNIYSDSLKYEEDYIAFAITNQEPSHLQRKYPECFVDDNINVSIVTKYDVEHKDISDIKCDVGELPKLLKFLME
jgi:hypothetical protein